MLIVKPSQIKYVTDDKDNNAEDISIPWSSSKPPMIFIAKAITPMIRLKREFLNKKVYLIKFH